MHLPVPVHPALTDMTTKQLSSKLAVRFGVSAVLVEEALRFRLRTKRLTPPSMVARTYVWSDADLDRALESLSDYRPRQPA
jgi:hypothetical protein